MRPRRATLFERLDRDHRLTQPFAGRGPSGTVAVPSGRLLGLAERASSLRMSERLFEPHWRKSSIRLNGRVPHLFHIRTGRDLNANHTTE